MRKTFTLFIALMALCVSSWATPIKVGDFYYEIRDYGVTYAELVKVSGEYDWKSYYEVSGDITIPGTINDGVSDYPVYIIGNTAFGECTGITSVTVEEGVNYISNFAFMGCSNLTTATLPSTITDFGNQVFGNSGLTSITIRATSPADISENNPFADASSLAHIYVPATSVDAYKTAWSDYASIIEEIPSGPAPVTVEWNQAKVASVDVWCGYGNDPALQTVDGIIDITVTATAPEGDDYAQFNTYVDDEYHTSNTSIYISNGGTITFAPASGKLKSIVIECGYKDPSLSVAGSGWTWNSTGTYSGQLIWTSATEEGASSVVLASNGSSFSFGSISSIEFVFVAEEAASADPTPAATTITWETADLATINVEMGYNSTGQSQYIKDIIVTNSTDYEAGQYCHFNTTNGQYNGEDWPDFSISNGGSLTFAPAEGKLTRIVITCDDIYPSNLAAGSGWVWDGSSKLTWSDENGATSVVLAGDGSSTNFSSGPIRLIEFTVKDAAAPAANSVTWTTPMVKVLDLYQNSGATHAHPTTVEMRGVEASVSAGQSGTYAHFMTQGDNTNIYLRDGGTLTFTSATREFESIVINFDGENGGSGYANYPTEWNSIESTLTWEGEATNTVVLADASVDKITSIVFTFVSAAPADPEPETIPGPSFKWEQRQVNHVRLIADYGGEPATAPVIKNIITSITKTGNSGNCYFGYWGEKGKLNIGNCGYLTFQSIVGDLRAIVITCSSVTTAEYLSAGWTYDGEAGTLTWVGEYASDEVSISGNININISEIEFYYTAAAAPRLGQSFYDEAYQLYVITGAKTAKVAQQQWLSHTLDIPASVEDGGVTYYITEIDDYAFQNDLDLPNVMGGENIARIGAHAFDGCLRMDEIDIESKVLDEIGEAAFKGCKLMQDIGFYTELPPVLGTNAFDDTRYLNHILVPSGNLEAYQAASGWSAYAAKINARYSDPQVGEQFFHRNQTTTNIYAVLRTSPKEAKVLPYTAEVNAIYPITRTGTLVIPEEALYIHNMYTITGIGANAYKDSTRFTTVMMPQAVKLIEEGAFRNCTGVEKVYFLWDDPTVVTWADANQGLDFKTATSGNTKIFVPENRLAAYQAWAPAWASCMIGAEILDITATGDPNNNLRHYRTFYDSQADYLLPPSVWAYAGYVSGDEFILRSVAFDGEILPRGTAVVLESETPTYRLIPVGNDAPLYAGPNDLIGTDVAIPRTSVGNNGENVYVLGKQATIGGDLKVGMGMYRYTGEYLGAHKAYMIVGGTSGAPTRARFLFRHEDETTDIENVQENDATYTKILRNGQLIILKDGKEYNTMGQIVK
ncbi:MAG: leucine-rich repeat protein [Paludibacteraceae bacterium]|nr:leucine-rich repeat protein [Paludibacteraceae bacterium]